MAQLASLVELGQSIRAQLAQVKDEVFLQIPEGDVVIQDRVEYERKKKWRRIGLVASLVVSVGSFVCVLYSAITGSSVPTQMLTLATSPPVQPVVP